MTDYLILLLSTDWFLPYWSEIGINISDDKAKIGVQQGCRKIVNEMAGEFDDFHLVDFSEGRKQDTTSKFRALLSEWKVNSQTSTTLNEWANLSHRELTAAVLCARLNSEIDTGEMSSDAPQLEFSIRAEVVKIWETYALSAEIFHDVCLQSNTEWDIRTQKLLVSSKTLVNQLWRVLLNHRLQAFWADLRERLASSQLQKLISWYRAMVANITKDPSVLLPSYIK